MMHLKLALLYIGLGISPLVFAAANCQHSHSWQCQGHHSDSHQSSQGGTGISSGGQTPDPGKTNSHLGTAGTTSVPMMTLQPAQPVSNPVNPVVVVPPKTKVPVPPTPSIQVNPIVAPPLVGYGRVPPQQVYMVPPRVVSGQSAVPVKPVLIPPPKQPPRQPPIQVYAIPPKAFTGQGKVPQIVQSPVAVPPRQVYPNPQPVIIGYGKVPPQPVNVIPSQTISGQGQVPQPQQIPGTKQVTGGQVPAQGAPPGGGSTTKPPVKPTHILVNNQTGNMVIGGQLTKTDFGKQVVEPGIMNSRVTLYRSHDAREIAFKDTIPMDVTGFHFTFVGIKEPVFATPAHELPAGPTQEPPTEPVSEFPGEKGKTFLFYFDFASARVPARQFGIYDEIVDYYRATGKRLIVTSETDGFGSGEYNEALARHRASAVIDELRNRGIEEKDIEMHLRIRYGRSDPSSADAHRLSTLERVTWVHFPE